MNDSSIAEFYRNRSIFLTGATGFIGKVLIEKLLRTCYDIEKIYILVRPKTDQNVQARVKNFLNSEVFSYLHSHTPDVLQKVVGIGGDVLEDGLNISEDDRKTLIEDVSVVFHAAASIRFNDTLKYATDINIKGTIRVVELCRQLNNLVALIHVSTAFSNCDRTMVDEVVYPAPMEPKRVLGLTEWLKEDVLESITERLIESKTTTYHFTKSITESLLEKESEHLPIVIVRPSVVVGSWKEPLPGYTETMYHINGILVGSGRGVLRVLHCNPNSVVDIVPVDMVTNLLIAAAWFKVQQKSTKLSLYNYVSGVDKPITYGQLRDLSLPILRDSPFLYPVWYPQLTLIQNQYGAKVVAFFVQRIPAYVLDKILKLIGMKPRLERIMNRIEKSQKLNKNFLHNEFVFSNNNVKTLWNNLNGKDKEIFYFNLEDIPWDQFLRNYILGCKQYVVKENLSTLPKARTQMNRMCWVYNILYWFLIMPFVFWLFTAVFA